MDARIFARRGLLLFIASFMVACGHVDQSGTLGTEAGTTAQSLSSDGESSNPDANIKRLDVSTTVNNAVTATRAVELAIYDAQSAISNITDANGNIGLNVFKTFFSGTVTARRHGLLSPLTNRLQSSFDVLFQKAAAVKATITTARLALTVANGQLDLSDPAQQVLATQIIAQMSALDAMEASLKAGMSALAGKVDQAQTGLTKLVSLGTSFIPVPGLNYVADLLINTFLLGDLTSLLNSMKLKLLSF